MAVHDTWSPNLSENYSDSKVIKSMPNSSITPQQHLQEAHKLIMICFTELAEINRRNKGPANVRIYEAVQRISANLETIQEEHLGPIQQKLTEMKRID